THRLDQVVVINVASTEPPFPLDDAHGSLEKLLPALERRPNVLPASSLYAWAALDLGWPYINFTPSLGATFPAALQLAQTRKAVCGGQDGKTGENLLESVLAPVFGPRNLPIPSRGRPNIFGNMDCRVPPVPDTTPSAT